MWQPAASSHRVVQVLRGQRDRKASVTNLLEGLLSSQSEGSQLMKAHTLVTYTTVFIEMDAYAGCNVRGYQGSGCSLS